MEQRLGSDFNEIAIIYALTVSLLLLCHVDHFDICRRGGGGGGVAEMSTFDFALKKTKNLIFCFFYAFICNNWAFTCFSTLTSEN